MREKKTVTFFNRYHNTSVRVRVRTDWYAPDCWQYIQQLAADGDPEFVRMERRIRRTLCGNSDCTCGTVRGW